LKYDNKKYLDSNSLASERCVWSQTGWAVKVGEVEFFDSSKIERRGSRMLETRSNVPQDPTVGVG
jgi:hypothetical protein